MNQFAESGYDILVDPAGDAGGTVFHLDRCINNGADCFDEVLGADRAGMQFRVTFRNGFQINGQVIDKPSN